MFASIRCYFVHRGSIAELAHRVDADFADLIADQPGFVSYAFVDCGEREYVTISAFRQANEAEASRDLARRWGDENMADFEFTVTAALHGEIRVGRATESALVPAHVGLASRFASTRSYRLRRGSVDDLLRVADEVFADRIAALDGFVAYQVLDCGDGDILAAGVFADRAAAARSDELALAFLREELEEFELDRTELICGGALVVGRATTALLEPAHA